MPTNRIQIEFEDGAATCRVWDSGGVEHDVTGIFQEVRDLTGKARSSTSLALTANALTTDLKFGAITKKELTFDVEAAVIDQILQML